MTITKQAAKPDGGSTKTREPGHDADADLDGAHGDGAGAGEPSTANGAADGATKRDPAQKTPTPVDRSGRVASILDELEGSPEEADEAPADEPEQARTTEGDEKPADDTPADADDADESTEDETAEEADEPEADGESEEADDDNGEDEATAEGADADPDIPSDAELAKAPKEWRKRLDRMSKRLRETTQKAKASEAIAEFADRNHMPAPVLKNWLIAGAKVINAERPIDGALVLADEAYALIRDADPADASPQERASVLRQMADELDPDGSRPAQPEALPDALKDLVEAGVLTEKAARAAHAAEHQKAQPAGKSTATETRTRDERRRTQEHQRAAYERRVAAGHEAMRTQARGMAKDHPQLWPKIKAHVIKQLDTNWKDSAPEQWATIMRTEAKVFITEHTAQQAKAKAKPPPKPIRPSTGARASTTKGDDLDAILAEP